MKKMKKSLSLVLAALMSLSFVSFHACESETEETETKKIETYDVTIAAVTGGSVTADVSEIEQGKDVVFTITPEDGYVLDSLTINGGEVVVNGNTYVFRGVLCDLDVKAKFVEPNITVLFDTDGGETVESIKVTLGDTYGELPSAKKSGKRFLYWADKNGVQVRPTTVVTGEGEVTLTAVWQDVSEEEQAGLTPFSATTAYYDMAATKYGVVFHTKTEPITPQILVTATHDETTGAADFMNAAVVDCDYEPWFEEYVINGVVENLEFATKYSVKFGDATADVWSKTYTFTTREEEITETSFYYVADSQ